MVSDNPIITKKQAKIRKKISTNLSNGQVESTYYDLQGNVMLADEKIVYNDNGQPVYSEYDTRFNPLGVGEDGHSVCHYFYDNNNKLVSLINDYHIKSSGEVVRYNFLYEYSGMDQLIKTILVKDTNKPFLLEEYFYENKLLIKKITYDPNPTWLMHTRTTEVYNYYGEKLISDATFHDDNIFEASSYFYNAEGIITKILGIIPHTVSTHELGTVADVLVGELIENSDFDEYGNPKKIAVTDPLGYITEYSLKYEYY